jgi:hypothetical protein
MTPSEDAKPTSNTYMRLQNSQNIRITLQNMSNLFNTGLSPEALDICIKLCEAGVHPQSLAEVVLQIRREVQSIKNENA